MVGAFLQPDGVLIDTSTLDTLDRRQYRAGLGEVVKYGVILDRAVRRLESEIEGLRADHRLLREVVAQCCRLKARIVEQDEPRPAGSARCSTMGTRSATPSKPWPATGNCSMARRSPSGCCAPSRLAERLGRIDAALTERQRRLLAALGPPHRGAGRRSGPGLENDDARQEVQHGKLRLVLPSGLGHVDLVGDVSAEQVRAVLAR